MTKKRKKDIRKLFGAYLKKHREDVLRVDSVRQLSFSSDLDSSKLSKIEKGKLDIRFDTLLEVAITYKLTPDKLLIFPIEFWQTEISK